MSRELLRAFAIAKGNIKMQHTTFHQVSLEFSQVYVEGTIESEGCCDGGDDLANKSVQVGISGTFEVEITAIDFIDGFIVYQKTPVRMFQSGNGIIALILSV